jgi:hypothetical protein
LKREGKALILIYSHPEYYPPTLSSIDELSKIFNTLDVVFRPFLEDNWSYATNVNLKPSGRRVGRRETMIKNTFTKTFYHAQFILNVFKLILFKKYDIVLVYDCLPMLSLYLVRPFLNKNTKLWYHNHDVASFNNLKRYSIGWLAFHAQNKLMKRLSIFSLPAKERLRYFTISEKTEVFIIPNYPAKNRYTNIERSIKKEKTIHLVYQGTISEGHGLEEVTEAINASSQLENYRLNLIGHVSEEFKTKIERLNPKRFINYWGYISYKNLPKITAQNHIGIAVLIPKCLNFKTASLASNKIYEYVACGLPILYYADKHYTDYLAQYEWAFATDLSQKSVEVCILQIMNNYEDLAAKARADFANNLNFEKVFEPVINYLVKLQIGKIES